MTFQLINNRPWCIFSIILNMINGSPRFYYILHFISGDMGRDLSQKIQQMTHKTP